MRNFMASLGHTGETVFSKQVDASEIPVEATHGLWDVIHPSEDELVQRQKEYDEGPTEERTMTISQTTDAPPSYVETMQQLPLEFYFPVDLNVSVENCQVTYPGQPLPMFNQNAIFSQAYRRPWHDNFKPPHGPPIFCPISIGYGAEVGLEDGQQALWDPTGKFYFFLDHLRKVTFFEDPRPPIEPRQIVEKQNYVYGDRHHEYLPMTCRDVQVIEDTTRRALSKPHGFTLFACGVHGQKGIDGCTGKKGANGSFGEDGFRPGSPGRRGMDGFPGGPGAIGTRGADGIEASDVTLNLWGTPDELYASGSCRFVAQLGGVRCEDVLFVNCHGGDGGHGGCGGQGGSGGRGGRGGLGAMGSPGFNNQYGPGGNGGPGGDGGDGGNGGPGGPGGRGGDGGNAGCGGQCVIKTQDPCLLMLVEMDCMAGNSGKGGEGGTGGSGGVGGSGGDGGPGGCRGKGGTIQEANGKLRHYSNGKTGPNGFPGLCGHDGPSGMNALSGIDGHLAPHGGILWVVCSEAGGIVEQSGTRYDAHVTNLHIASGIDDGIFEPNESVIVSGMVMVNDGGLTLPSGAEAYIPCTQTMKFKPTRFTLPEINSGSSFVVPITYYGRIFDEPPPNKPGPFVSRAEFIPRIELLGRPFERSFLKQTLVVQYPVKLAFIRCVESLGRGEVGTLEIGVQNISQMAYGSCEGSGGKVVLQMHFDQRIIPVAAANIEMSLVPYTVTYDPNIRDSMYIQMHKIHPGETVTVQINIQMESRAELFELCFWQADVYLRDKLIEYNSEKIRVSPFYTPTDPPADVLMVTGSVITRREFVFWQTILGSLNVSVDFWDIDRYNGLSVDRSINSRHRVTWEGRYTGRLILYPYTDLQSLWGIDIARHFHGANFRDGPVVESNSSMVLFMPSTAAHHLPQGTHQRDIAMIHHLSLVDAPLQLEDSYAGIHMFMPGTRFGSTSPFYAREKRIMKTLEKNEPRHSYTMLEREVNVQPAGIFRYKYGSVDCRRCPLLRSSKFLFVDGFGGTKVAMSQDDQFLGPNTPQIPLASNFGQTYIATLFGIPLSSKLALLRPLPETASPLASVNLIFTLPNGLSLNKADLIVTCIAQEIADEVLNCSGQSQRMETVVETIASSPEDYVASGESILKGMKLIKGEIKKRKKKIVHQNVDQACQQIKRARKRVVRALVEAGVNDRDLPRLPYFMQLVDSDRFHFSHQYTMKDKRYNLIQ